MKRSTTQADRGFRLWAAAFWLILWQAAAMLLGQRLLLASPVETLARLFELVQTRAFFESILFTLGRILLGFLSAVLTSLLLGGLSARFGWVRDLFAPLVAAMKSVPVASFVIVALIWLPSRQLSVLISFLIAFPVLYASVLGGIAQTDPALLEMARVFRMPALRRILHIHLPSMLPQFRAAAGVAIGLAWKSGVAAEVIGIPGGSIGEKLYKAKMYLATPDLFAWTLAIVLMSILCERAFMALTDAAIRRLEGV